VTATSHLRARHNRSMNMGDALGTVIYRLSLADHVVFYDCDTGQRWTHGQRHRYRQSAAYKARRARIVARRRCDVCGTLGGCVLWTARSEDIGAEDHDNTIVLCRHCNDRVYRAREQLGFS
jgi:hypothetical protein